MEFIYAAYGDMLDLLKKNKYNFSDYSNYKNYKKCVILRHDVDFNLEKALTLAKYENSNNVMSTYFVLLSTDFYNVFSKESTEILKNILILGHNIGLHFDEKKYEITDADCLRFYVSKESNILKEVLNQEIETVSMHRPSKWILENDVKFDKITNSYSNYFFSEFKYLSDSRMFWREDVLEIIAKNSYDRLHILTHPFWYSEKVESLNYKLLQFINDSKAQRYNNINNNFKNLGEVLTLEKI